jgi:hypothetical protein
MTALLACCWVCAPTGVAASQDMFELEVFEYESVPPGGYQIELHTNGLTRGPAAAVSPATA